MKLNHRIGNFVTMTGGRTSETKLGRNFKGKYWFNSNMIEYVPLRIQILSKVVQIEGMFFNIQIRSTPLVNLLLALAENQQQPQQ